MTGWRLGLLRRARADCQSHRRRPKPQHQQPDLLRAEGRRRRADRPAGSSAEAGWPNSTSAAPTPGTSSTAFPASRCVNAKGAFYLFPNISQDRPQVHRVLRQAARSRRKSPPCPASPSAPTITSASATPRAWRTSRRAWSASRSSSAVSSHNGRAELLLRPDFETTSAAMLFSDVIANIAALAGLDRAKRQLCPTIIRDGVLPTECAMHKFTSELQRNGG